VPCLFPCSLGILLSDEYQQPQLQNGLYTSFRSLHQQQQTVKHTVHYTVLISNGVLVWSWNFQIIILSSRVQSISQQSWQHKPEFWLSG
jgi:hypothetical protein